MSSSDDHLTPTSEFGYMWHVPFVFYVGGEEHIHWFEAGGTASENAEFEINLAEFSENTSDLVINPNANIWLRMHFNEEYIQHLNSIAWGAPKCDPLFCSSIKAGNIGHMINDYNDFLMGNNPLVRPYWFYFNI